MRILLIFFCLCLCLLTACGPKQMAVKYADTYIERQVAKRLPLYDSQEKVLSRDIDNFLNDHKDRVRGILPILERINFSNGKSLDENWPKFEEAYLDIAKDFSEILARHISAFDSKQEKDFLRRMRGESTEIFQRSRNERRAKIISRIKQFLGEITKEQEKILNENQKNLDDQVIVRNERRSRLHDRFKSILDQDLSREAKEKMLHEAFIEYQSEALKDSKNLDIAKAFIPTLTDKQKKHLQQKISELKELLTYFLETAY